MALKRVPGDYYPTPAWVVHAIVPHLPPPRRVFDPCCGVGELLEAFPDAIDHFGIELDADRAQQARECGLAPIEIRTADALGPDEDWGQWCRDWDLLICNPPFALVDGFLERALQWSSYRRTVAVLARMSVLEPTKGRSEALRSRPFDVYVLPERPRFRADTKGADSMTCIWLVAGPGRNGVMRWLEPRTSDDDGRPRKRARVEAAPEVDIAGLDHEQATPRDQSAPAFDDEVRCG